MISVIIPIDNRTEYLEECLVSVQEQTYRDLEIICVFDGNAAGLNIYKKISEQDSRFKYIEIPQGGPGIARNAGLDIASGEYIAFCDSDDILPYKALKLLIQRIVGVKAEIDVVMGDFIEQFDSGSAVLCYMTGLGNGFDRFFAYISIWNRLYRRDFLNNNKIRFRARKQGEDLLFLADVFLCQPKVATARGIVYQWQRHETDKNKTLTHTEKQSDYLELIGSWELFIEKMYSKYHDDVMRHGRDACPYILHRLNFIKEKEQRQQALDKTKPFLQRLGWEKYPIRFFYTFRAMPKKYNIGSHLT